VGEEEDVEAEVEAEKGLLGDEEQALTIFLLVKRETVAREMVGDLGTNVTIAKRTGCLPSRWQETGCCKRRLISRSFSSLWQIPLK